MCACPRKTGIEAAQLIRRTKPDVRIIGLSVHQDEWFRDAMMRLGAGAYLLTDAPAEDLLARIREICGRDGSWTKALDA